eukprot:jgi/Chrzof1/10179/Cz04g31250.t1
MLELDYVVQSLTNAQKSSALVRVPSDSCTAGQSGRVQSQQVCSRAQHRSGSIPGASRTPAQQESVVLSAAVARPPRQLGSTGKS